MKPSFFTGRHTYGILCIIATYLILIGFTRKVVISGVFLGSEKIRDLYFDEILGVLTILLVGSALLPRLRFTEPRNSLRLRIWYGISALLTCTLPLIGILALHLSLYVMAYLYDMEFSAGFGLINTFNSALDFTLNAIIIGSVALIFVHFFGILGGIASILILYPILLYLSVSPIAPFVPYAATSSFFEYELPVAWACVMPVIAAFVWTLKRRETVRIPFWKKQII